MSWRWGMSFLGVWLTCSGALGTTARFLSVSSLVQASDATVLGTPLSQTCFWQGTRIYTLVKLRVAEVWSGSVVLSASTLDVIGLGGEVDGIGQRVEGAAILPSEGWVVLHLKRATSGEYYPIAMAQGVWWVVPSTQGSPRVFHPPTGRLLLLSAHTPLSLPATLQQLYQRVQKAIACTLT